MVVCSIRFMQNIKHKKPYATLHLAPLGSHRFGWSARGLSLREGKDGGHDGAVPTLPGCFFKQNPEVGNYTDKANNET